jgi:predicted nucleotidyltransferase
VAIGTNNLKNALLHWKRSLEQQLAKLDGETAWELSAGQFADPIDANLQRADAMLNGVLREVAKLFPGRALVAYGSRVAGEADAHSDLDLLVLEYDRNAKPIQAKMEVQGVDVDIARVGFNILLKGIRSRSRNNNNWFLSALRQCCIYGDRDGEGRRLRAVAQDVWKQGPPAPTAKQLAAARAGLLRQQDSTQKLCKRANASPEAVRLARMRCDQLAAQAIYQFYWVRCEWTTSLHRAVGVTRSRRGRCGRRYSVD